MIIELLTIERLEVSTGTVDKADSLSLTDFTLGPLHDQLHAGTRSSTYIIAWAVCRSWKCLNFDMKLGRNLFDGKEKQ